MTHQNIGEVVRCTSTCYNSSDLRSNPQIFEILVLRMNKISSCFDHIGILLIIQMFLVVSGGACFTFSINKNISDSTYTTNSTNTTTSDSPQSIEHECTIYMAMSTIPNAGFGV